MMSVFRAVLAAALLVACSSNSNNGDAGQPTAFQACMHICTCEAGMPGLPGDDGTCQADCQQSEGPWSSSSSSSFSSSSSSSSSQSTGISFSTTSSGVDFAASEQACVTCFANASCSDIIAGDVCASDCQ